MILRWKNTLCGGCGMQIEVRRKLSKNYCSHCKRERANAAARERYANAYMIRIRGR